MKVLFCAMFLALVAASVAAQPLTIQPDAAAAIGKAVYADASQFPHDSAQCHWLDPNSMPGMPTHLHIEAWFPRYAIVDQSFVVKFAVVAFHLQGSVTGINGRVYRGPAIRDIVWDETGTSTRPTMIGDPTGVKTWTGHFTMDPSTTDAHGWAGLLLYGFAHLDSGVDLQAELAEPYYRTSQLDAPLNVLAGWTLSALCSDTNPTPNRWGAQVSEVGGPVHGGWLPVSSAPLTAPFPLSSDGYGYTSDLPTDATFDEVIDLDLHHGIPGTVLRSSTKPASIWINNGIGFQAPIDPAVLAASTPPVGLPPGVHKHAFRWFETSADGTIQNTTLLVTDVAVADGTVPSEPPPPPPPPPPPVSTLQSCTLALTGTSTDGGHTVTVTASPVTWVCR